MTCNKLNMGKGATFVVLCRTIHPSKHNRKKYPNMERGKRLKDVIVLRREMNKIRQKEAGCIIFTQQDSHDDDALIELYSLERSC